MTLPDATAAFIDPVCGMTVDPSKGKSSLEHDGTTYYFCCAGCRDKFAADPQRWLQAKAAPQPASMPADRADRAGGRSEYTCPMHPEVVQIGPGACPICGMALEPKAISLEETENPELADMTRRLWLSALFALPVLLLAMTAMLPAARDDGVERSAGLDRARAGHAGLPVGGVAVLRARRAVDPHGHLNMFTLIGLGVSVAFVYSLVAVAGAGRVSAVVPRRRRRRCAVYFEAAAVIVTLILLGQVLELRARAQTGAAIRKLLGLAPTTARRVRPGGAEEDVPLAAVARGDRLRVRPGEKVPVDGVVRRGRAAPSTSRW